MSILVCRRFVLSIVFLLVHPAAGNPSESRLLVQRGLGGRVEYAAISSDGLLIATLAQAFLDSTLQVWSVTSRHLVYEQRIPGSPERLDFIGDDTLVALTSAECLVVRSGEAVTRAPRWRIDRGGGPGIDGARWYVHASRTRADARVIDAGGRYALIVRNRHGVQQVPLDEEPDGIAVSPDGRLVVLAFGGELVVYEADREPRILVSPSQPSLRLADPTTGLGLRFTPSGDSIVVGHGPRILGDKASFQALTLQCIDVYTGEERWSRSISPAFDEIVAHQIERGFLPNRVRGAKTVAEVRSRFEESSYFGYLGHELTIGLSGPRFVTWRGPETFVMEDGLGRLLLIDVADGGVAPFGEFVRGRLLAYDPTRDAFLTTPDTSVAPVLPVHLELTPVGQADPGIVFARPRAGSVRLSAGTGGSTLYVRCMTGGDAATFAVDFGQGEMRRILPDGGSVDSHSCWVDNLYQLLPSADFGDWNDDELDLEPEFDSGAGMGPFDPVLMGRYPILSTPGGLETVLVPLQVRGVPFNKYLNELPDGTDEFEAESEYYASGGVMRLVSPAEESGHDALVFHGPEQLIVFDPVELAPIVIIPWEYGDKKKHEWPAVATFRDSRLFVLTFGGRLAEIDIETRAVKRSLDLRAELDGAEHDRMWSILEPDDRLWETLGHSPTLDRDAGTGGRLDFGPDGSSRPFLEWAAEPQDLIVSLEGGVFAVPWHGDEVQPRRLALGSTTRPTRIRVSPTGRHVVAQDDGVLSFINTKTGQRQPWMISRYRDVHLGSIVWLRNDRFVAFMDERCLVFELPGRGPPMPLAEIVAGPDAGIAVVSRDGFFWSTSLVPPALRETEGFDTKRFDEVSKKFNRPADVLDAIGLTDEAVLYGIRELQVQYVSELGPSANEAEGSIEFEKPPSPWTTQRTTTLWISPSAHSAGDTIDVHVNGVPRVTRRLSPDDVADGPIGVEAPLWPGENRIRLSVTSADGRTGQSSEVLVTCTVSSLPGETLYVGIAFDTYSHMPDLRMAESDAQRMSETFKRTSDGAFRELRIAGEKFLGTGLKPESVLDRVREFSMSATADDRLVVFFAGHGAYVGDDQVLCLPESRESDLLETGLALRSLERAIAESPAQTRLVLVDSCAIDGGASEGDPEAKEHLGQNITMLGRPGRPIQDPPRSSGRNFDRLFASYSAPSGTTTLVATSRGEIAYEDEVVGGFFTHAVTEALLTGEADTNGDGVIRARELTEHTARKTIARTGGRQRPTIRRSVDASDLPLAGGAEPLTSVPIETGDLLLDVNDNAALLYGNDENRTRLIHIVRGLDDVPPSIREADAFRVSIDGFMPLRSKLTRDGRTVIIVGALGGVQLWTPEDVEPVRVSDDLVASDGELGCAFVTVSTDGSHAAVAVGETLVLVDLATKQTEMLTLPSQAHGIAISADSERVVVSGIRDGSAWVITTPRGSRGTQSDTPVWLGPATSTAVERASAFVAVRNDIDGVADLTLFDLALKPVRRAEVTTDAHIVWRHNGLLFLPNDHPEIFDENGPAALVTPDGRIVGPKRLTARELRDMGGRLVNITSAHGPPDSSVEQFWDGLEHNPVFWWSRSSESILGVGERHLITLEWVGFSAGRIVRWYRLPESVTAVERGM